MTRSSELGFIAEGLAARFLESKDYKIISHNYKKPWGEIDLIAQKEGILVFVEVKASSIGLGGFEAELRADKSKIEKVIRTARTYLIDKKLEKNQEWQIDIISITFNRNRKVAKIKHFKNIST